MTPDVILSELHQHQIKQTEILTKVEAWMDRHESECEARKEYEDKEFLKIHNKVDGRFRVHNFLWVDLALAVVLGFAWYYNVPYLKEISMGMTGVAGGLTIKEAIA